MEALKIGNQTIALSDGIKDVLLHLCRHDNTFDEWYLYQALKECKIEIEAGDPGKCFCGQPGEWTTDPFTEEIHDELHWQFMCEYHYKESADEI